MKGTEDSKYTMMIDSGTTFTYLPRTLFNLIQTHFKWFCSMDPINNCKAQLKFTRPDYICWGYDEKLNPIGPLEFFSSLPIIRFVMQTKKDKNGQSSFYSYDWFPSEYLYIDEKEDHPQYCIAVDIKDSNRIMFGGTLMRQHAVIIDVENQQVGFSRSSCSLDKN